MLVAPSVICDLLPSERDLHPQGSKRPLVSLGKTHWPSDVIFGSIESSWTPLRRSSIFKTVFSWVAGHKRSGRCFSYLSKVAWKPPLPRVLIHDMGSSQESRKTRVSSTGCAERRHFPLRSEGFGGVTKPGQHHTTCEA